jgi:hypothetical protein
MASEEESKVASQEIVGQRTLKAIEKPQGHNEDGSCL